MSTIITFELCGFSHKRGFLHGDPDRAPISVTRCGIFTLVRFLHQAPAVSFSDFLKANVTLPEYLAEHRPQMRQRIRRAVAKAKRQARAEVADELQMWKDDAARNQRRAEKYSAENFDLAVAARALARLVHTPSRAEIRDTLLKHGYTIKEGQTDLKPYVYEAAYDLIGRKPPQEDENPL